MLKMYANLIKLDNIRFDLCSNSFKLKSYELRLMVVVATTTTKSTSQPNEMDWILNLELCEFTDK